MDVIINPVSESVFNVSVTAASADFTALANTAVAAAAESTASKDIAVTKAGEAEASALDSLQSLQILQDQLSTLTLTPIIEYGGINISGGLLTNTVRIRTQLTTVQTGIYTVSFSSLFIYSIIASYNSDGTFNSRLYIENGSFTVPNGITQLRIAFQKIDGSEITVAEKDSLALTLRRDMISISNQFAGLKISAIGDSIAYGYIPPNSTGYPGQLNSFIKLTAEKLFMTFVNQGIIGSTIGARAVNDPYKDPFVYRVSSIPDDSDFVLVMGGTNDIRFNILLGTFTDTVETTFYGALHVLCLALLNKFRISQGTAIGKTKHIVFCTPIKLNTDINTVYNGFTFSQYVEAIKEVCDYYSIPVLDLYNLSGINPHILRTVTGTVTGYTSTYNPYITDGVHPTQEGHYIMSNILTGFLRTLI